MRKYYELELALKDAEHNRCDRPDSECSRRTPPRRPITINNQNKEDNTPNQDNTNGDVKNEDNSSKEDNSSQQENVEQMQSEIAN